MTGSSIPGYLGRVLGPAGGPLGSCFQALPGLVTALHVVEEVISAAAVPRLAAEVDLGAATIVQVDGLAHDSPPATDATVLAVDRIHDLAVLEINKPWPVCPCPPPISSGRQLYVLGPYEGQGRIWRPGRIRPRAGRNKSAATPKASVSGWVTASGNAGFSVDVSGLL